MVLTVSCAAGGGGWWGVSMLCCTYRCAALHRYTTSDTPLSHGWSYSKAQGGDPHKISKLAPGAQKHPLQSS